MFNILQDFWNLMEMHRFLKLFLHVTMAYHASGHKLKSTSAYYTNLGFHAKIYL